MSRARVALGVVLLVIAVGSAVLSIIQTRQTEALAACVTRYSNRVAVALDARSRSSADSQKALDELLTRVGMRLSRDRPGDREAINQALNDYSQKRRMATQLRVQHPLPAPPRAACNR